jgi:pyruvate, orthophosphate dikinase
MFASQFFASDERIKAVRQMIMSGTVEQRQKALDRLLPYQRSDFEGIFRAMDGTGSLLLISS